jgi:hypothetical protein
MEESLGVPGTCGKKSGLRDGPMDRIVDFYATTDLALRIILGVDR